MIDSFSFTPFPQVYFGSGEFLKLPERLLGSCSRLIIVSGRNSLKKNGQLAAFTQQLDKLNITSCAVSIDSEPTPKNINKIVADYQKHNADMVIAVGGGSVLDAGKAIAAMLPLNDDISHYLEGVGDKQHPGNTLPFIAVPTTAGTGSEATKNAVITAIGDQGFKKSLRHDNFIPTIAVIDPELMLSCPPALTAACGLDTFTQLLESYVSSQANPLSDALAFDALARVIDSLPKVVKQGDIDLDARADMAYGALISGITLANAGLGLVHGFASAIGGFFPIAHGVICGSLLPSVTEMNVAKLQESDSPEHIERLNKHIKVARLFPQSHNMDDKEVLQHMIDALYHWVENFKIPKLGHFSLGEKDVERIISASSLKNNPIQLSHDDIHQALFKRL